MIQIECKLPYKDPDYIKAVQFWFKSRLGISKFKEWPLDYPYKDLSLMIDNESQLKGIGDCPLISSFEKYIDYGITGPCTNKVIEIL
jgi:hypothetical protein